MAVHFGPKERNMLAFLIIAGLVILVMGPTPPQKEETDG